ncbi:hypothetical protein JJD41_24110 [Oxynema sp. CENA135]|nr:hypothetical protein [Oxynema sp. CENA135]
MVRGSFASMQTEPEVTEVTFYYDDGHHDSFKVPLSPQQFQVQLNDLLGQGWAIFHLMDNTVIVCMSKITKIEIKPPITQYQVSGTFSNAERVTTLQRGAKGRLGIQT